MGALSSRASTPIVARTGLAPPKKVGHSIFGLEMYLFPPSLFRFSSRKTASSLSDSGEMMALNSETVAAAAAASGVPFHLHV